MSAIRNSAKAIIIRDGTLLAIECTDPQGHFYILPGGGQEHGETLLDALRRECREEISADVVVHDIVFIREYLSRNHEFAEYEADAHQVEFMFQCSLEEGSDCEPGSVPDTYQTGVAWLPLNRLSEFRLYPKALIAILQSQTIALHNAECPCVYLGDVN